jgi:hypothetical protein
MISIELQPDGAGREPMILKREVREITNSMKRGHPIMNFMNRKWLKFFRKWTN